MLTENDIARIARRIVDAFRPMAVGIFGSYAIGSAHEKSDLDLLIIREAMETRASRARAVRRALFGAVHLLDVQVFTPIEFEDAVYEEQSFTWIIVRQVRIYHWTDEATRAVPSLLPRVSVPGVLPDIAYRGKRRQS